MPKECIKVQLFRKEPDFDNELDLRKKEAIQLIAIKNGR